MARERHSYSTFIRVAAASAAMSAAALGTAMAGEPCEPAWDNTMGQPGLNTGGLALTVYNGHLVVAGGFITAGDITVNRIALWDNVGWHSFTSGDQTGLNGTVYALTVYNGDLIAGGQFSMAGGQTVNHIARWDGSAWHPFAVDGVVGLNGQVRALAVFNGDLIAGGGFTTAGGANIGRGIARWDGTTWHSMDGGFQFVTNFMVSALAVYNGELIAAGRFNNTDAGVAVNHVARWDGSAWQPLNQGLGGGSSSMLALTVYDGDLIVGGLFAGAAGVPGFMNNISRWDGSSWHPLASGTSSTVRALTVYDGDLIAGGSYALVSGQTANSIARWDGSAWSTMNGGLGWTTGTPLVHALLTHNSQVVAAGSFSSAGGLPANHIAAWHGCAPEPPIPGDLTGSGSVGVSDLLILLASWGDCDDCASGNCPADLTGDCAVGVADLLILLANWG